MDMHWIATDFGDLDVFEFVPVEGWAHTYLADGIHPDARGRAEVAGRLATVLESTPR